jgi:hypothetical protein
MKIIPVIAKPSFIKIARFFWISEKNNHEKEGEMQHILVHTR